MTRALIVLFLAIFGYSNADIITSPDTVNSRRGTNSDTWANSKLYTSGGIRMTGLQDLLELAENWLNAPVQATYYVSPTGSDSNPGTLAAPFQTITKARDVVEGINGDMSGDIIVNLRGGAYNIASTIAFDESDSGTNGYNVIYQAYNDETPIISGGVAVTGWTRHDGDIWKARLVRDKKLRALYVNGKRAVMARMSQEVTGQGGYGTFTITGDEPWASTSGTEFAGIKFNPGDVGVYNNPQDVELVQTNIWSEAILCADSLFSDDGYTVATLQQPYGAIALNMSWVPVRADKSFYIRNAYELLDEPGEFYFNKQTDTLYYYSRGEDMSTAQVFAPMVEGLVSIAGSSTSSRVHNIQFHGLTFACDDYLMSSLGNSHGWVSVQSLSQFTRYIPNGNWHPNHYNDITIPKGTVNLCNADSIRFERNRFEHLASAVALSLENDVINTTVIGNCFTDLMGTSVNVGHPQHYKIGDGEQFPAGVEGVCKNILIADNYVRQACLDFRQVEGMTGFFAENVSIMHNDVSGTPYGGITLGWWWGNSGIPPSTVAKHNKIMYNKVGDTHQALRDGGVIYVLGEQPGSEMAYNYCYDGPRCIYPDDGSAYWSIHDNVILNPELWLHIWSPRCHDLTMDHNFVKSNTLRNDGTDCPVTDTIVESEAPAWSQDAQAIINTAGLEPAYRDIIPPAPSLGP